VEHAFNREVAEVVGTTDGARVVFNEVPLLEMLPNINAGHVNTVVPLPEGDVARRRRRRPRIILGPIPARACAVAAVR